MSTEKGSLSINSENIFPIIKKWLYSDHDIFMRELISNGCDAITKLKKLEVIGEYNLPEGKEWKVDVSVNQNEKTIKITDNGIGMTADEVKEYINQIAFSGAEAFLAKYKDKANDDQIIGHFGLGFYSAFMVAHKVTINTLSWQKDAAPVLWASEEGMTLELSEGTRTEGGTEITLYLNEDSYEFSNEYRAKEVIEKYCSFMPVPIYFTNENAEKKDDDKDKEVKPLNDVAPLWTKNPSECKDEEYKDFYRKVFHDYKEPLFYIHLNMDYPFRLKGILYFPKINMEYERIEGTIKLYSNQVFIADNIKEVIPEYLLLLKGAIDCPDLPLNVSRSALQNDGFVKKISDYITKKVADKLTGMYNVERESYEKYWDDIAPFLKYGCLKDEKFRDRMKDYMLFKDLNDKYLTLNEYLEGGNAEEKESDGLDGSDFENDDKDDIDGEAKDVTDGDKSGDAEKNDDAAKDAKDSKAENKTDSKPKKLNKIVYYVTDVRQQSQYIKLFKDAGMNAVILPDSIDQPFISQLEAADEKNELRFMRIDADVSATVKDDLSEEDEKLFKQKQEQIAKIIKEELAKDKLDVELQRIKNEKVASVMVFSEETRRMQDMMKMYGMSGSELGGDEGKLVLNANHPLVQYVLEHKKGDTVKLICQQLYDLALMTYKPLPADAMTRFVERSNDILLKLTK